MSTENDFYEDDEPQTEVAARFERGEKHETAPPSLGHTAHLGVAVLEPILTSATNQLSRELAGR
ncbi:hypothetical protein ACFXJ5_10865 [Streptomyces sp. NPDC059373]